MVPDESTVVRPPEFERVLEELHVVRLSGQLKSEIQARRDLEDVYQRLLRDVTDLEQIIEDGKAEIARAQDEAKYALADKAAARGAESALRSQLTRIKSACWLLLAIIGGLVVLAWQDLSSLALDLLARFLT